MIHIKGVDVNIKIVVHGNFIRMRDGWANNGVK